MTFFSSPNHNSHDHDHPAASQNPKVAPFFGGGPTPPPPPPPPRPPLPGTTTRLGQISAIDMDITVIQGRDLVAKDRNIFGKRTSSDPYVKVHLVQEISTPIVGGGAGAGASGGASSRILTSMRAIGNRFQSNGNGSGSNSGSGSGSGSGNANIGNTNATSNNNNNNNTTNTNTNKQTLKLGKTSTIYKTLNPVWNETIFGSLRGRESLHHHTRTNPAYLEFHIYDEDQLSRSDCMGIVKVPVPTEPRNMDFTQWYHVPPDSARGAKGLIQIRIQTTISRSRILVRGNTFALTKYNQKSKLRTKQTIKLGLSWDVNVVKQKKKNNNNHIVDNNNTTEEGVDLDASCVAVSHEGYIIMPDTVYYGNLANSNKSVVHSGDQQDGKAEGDDEHITLQLDKIPNHILAMYIILTVATPNVSLSHVPSIRVRVQDITPIDPDVPPTSFRQEQTLCTFIPSTHIDSQDATAMFMVRIARDQANVPKGKVGKKWILTPMEDTHPTARDFGSLIPHIKSYTRDLVPDIRIDPTERVAILRKGGNIRVQDYCAQNQLPTKITFGLAWDVTDGEYIDLDASAICLDANLNLVDMVWWKQLHSKDYNIVHHGDEREGDQLGDDELIDLYLNNMSRMGEHCRVQYIGFVVNSYSGQKLKDVDRASCHLFDPETNIEMATYALTDAKNLEGVSALLVAYLHRATAKYEEGVGPVLETVPQKNANDGEWCLTIISEKCNGRTVKANVEDFQNYLRQNPPQPATVDHNENEDNSVITAEMPPPVPLSEDYEMDDFSSKVSSFGTPNHAVPTPSTSALISMTEEEKRTQFDAKIAADEGRRQQQHSPSPGSSTPLSPRFQAPTALEQNKRNQFDAEIAAEEGIQPSPTPKFTVNRASNTPPSILEQDKRNRFDFEIDSEKSGRRLQPPVKRGLTRS